jgi:Leucine-rich repeat (LRR) protein
MRAVTSTKLRELDLGDNRLVGLEGRGRCGSLRVLKLDSNYLSDQVTQALIYHVPMPKLKSLDISRNRMQHPQTITVLLALLPGLQTLTLAENAI